MTYALENGCIFAASSPTTALAQSKTGFVVNINLYWSAVCTVHVVRLALQVHAMWCIKKSQYQVSRSFSIKKSTAVEFILIIVQVIPVHHLTELRKSGHRRRSRGRKVIRVKVLVTRAW